MNLCNVNAKTFGCLLILLAFNNATAKTNAIPFVTKSKTYHLETVPNTM